MMKGFKDSTRTVAGHHAPTGRSVGQVANFHPNMEGSALVRRQTPTTQLDADAGNTGSLEPGYAKGGKPEKHFHVHHHYHGGKVTRSKAAKMEMEGEKEVDSERSNYAKGGKSRVHIKAKNRGALHRDMGIPQGKKIPKEKIRAKLARDKAEHNVKGVKRDVFALNFGHKGHAEGGHIHDDTRPVAPDYASGGTIDKMNCGGALYAKGGNVDETRRVAREEIHRHVNYPAPKGHKGLGRMIRKP